MAKDDSGFLNFASSGLDESSPASSKDINVTGAADEGSSFSGPPPATSTSTDDPGQSSRPPSRPPDAEDGARPLSPMSSDVGPDTTSTDVGFEKPPPPTKTTGCEELFKKPVEPVENIPLGQAGQPPAMMSTGAAGVNPMSWVTLLYDYSQGTTMHGLPYITHRARFVARRSVQPIRNTAVSVDPCVAIFSVDILTFCSHCACMHCIYNHNLFHYLLLRSYLYHCVWSVMTARNLTPEKREIIIRPTL